MNKTEIKYINQQLDKANFEAEEIKKRLSKLRVNSTNYNILKEALLFFEKISKSLEKEIERKSKEQWIES